MPEHRIASREEWLAARKNLLAKEKELTRRSDELARERQELPWVRVDKEYVFQTDDGPKTLTEPFDGRSQLIVYHFMHGPNTPDGCKGCTFHANHFDSSVPHLNHHDVTFLCASRSPLPVLKEYKERMGWSFPWVSSEGTDFNRDFASWTEKDRAHGTGYNFGTPKRKDIDLINGEELMALSCFALEDGVVYHTYTSYDRGTDVLNPVWQLLDRVPLGRSEGAEEGWPQRHVEYDDAPSLSS